MTIYGLNCLGSYGKLSFIWKYAKKKLVFPGLIFFRSKLEAKTLILAYSANQYHKLSPGVTVAGPITGLGRLEREPLL